MGRIAINGMRFYAHHGCFEQERAIGTNFMVDLCLLTDTSKAEKSDSIVDTVNYLEVYQFVSQEMQCPSNLLENVAHRIGERTLTEYPEVEWVCVKVYKMNPPLGGQMDSVSVEIEMSR